MVGIKRSWGVAAILAILPLIACSGTSQLVGSDGPTGGTTNGGSSSAGDRAGTGASGSDVPAALGQPCIATDEHRPDFAGFSPTEVSVEDHSDACASQVCLLDHFQGRASCKYGQSSAGGPCLVPGSTQPVSVAVSPQLVRRQADVASICSCHCAGSGPGPFCTCPDSMQCEHLVDALSLPGGDSVYAGSYCIPKGSQYDRAQLGIDCPSDGSSTCGAGP